MTARTIILIGVGVAAAIVGWRKLPPADSPYWTEGWCTDSPPGV